MFLTFEKIESERKNLSFLEIQYCTLNERKIKKIVDVNNIQPFRENSLYIIQNDLNDFIKHYESIFNSGIYNNLKTGKVDVFGINYYPKEQALSLIELIKKQKPKDYETLVLWLEQGFNYNGFYILGI